MFIRGKNGKVKITKNSHISFIHAHSVPNDLAKAMHTMSNIIYTSDDGNTQNLEITTGSDMSAIVKIVEDKDDVDVFLIFNTEDNKAMYWAQLMDGYYSDTESHIHNAKVVNNVTLYMNFEKTMFAVDDQYNIEFINDKLKSDSIIPYSQALLIEGDIY